MDSFICVWAIKGPRCPGSMGRQKRVTYLQNYLFEQMPELSQPPGGIFSNGLSKCSILQFYLFTHNCVKKNMQAFLYPELAVSFALVQLSLNSKTFSHIVI